jgi:hypothetical protein
MVSVPRCGLLSSTQPRSWLRKIAFPVIAGRSYSCGKDGTRVVTRRFVLSEPVRRCGGLYALSAVVGDLAPIGGGYRL